MIWIKHNYINCHFLTLIYFIKQNMVAPLFYICIYWEQEETLVNTNTKINTALLNSHMCLCMCMTLSWVYKKWWNLSMNLKDYPFVSRRYWSFTTNGYYFWAIIASSAFWTYLQNFARPYSCCGITQTDRQTDRHTNWLL